MERHDDRAVGDARAEIATRIVRLHSEYYGKGPTKAKAYITEDVVVAVLEETFTKAERTLGARGARWRRSSRSAAASSKRWPTSSKASSSRPLAAW